MLGHCNLIFHLKPLLPSILIFQAFQVLFFLITFFPAVNFFQIYQITPAYYGFFKLFLVCSMFGLWKIYFLLIICPILSPLPLIDSFCSMLRVLSGCFFRCSNNGLIVTRHARLLQRVLLTKFFVSIV